MLIRAFHIVRADADRSAVPVPLRKGVSVRLCAHCETVIECLGWEIDDIASMASPVGAVARL